MPKGSITSLETDHARAGRVAAGLDHTVICSQNGGKSWTDLDPGQQLPCLPATGVTFAGDRLIMSTHNCGAYWTNL